MANRYIDPKLALKRAFYLRANPQFYLDHMVKRHLLPLIQEAVTQHFVEQGKDAVGSGGIPGTPWTGKTPRNLQIRAERGVPLDLPVLYNSGRLQQFVAHGVICIYDHFDQTVFVGLKDEAQPPYAVDQDAGAFIPHSPYGPIQLEKRPLLRFTREGYLRVQREASDKFRRHFLGDPAIPGPQG